MCAVGAALANDERDGDSRIAVRVAAARSRTCQHDRTAGSRPVRRLRLPSQQGPPRQAGRGSRATATSNAARASRRVESRTGNGELGRGHQKRDLGADQGDGVASPGGQVLDDPDVLAAGSGGELAVHQLVENDLVEYQPVAGAGGLGADPVGGEDARIDRAFHGVAGTQDADPGAAVAGGLRGDDLGDVKAGKGQRIAGLLQRQVGGVVGTDEEVGARPGQPLRALGQRGTDRLVLARLPGWHAPAHGDAVHRDVRMLVHSQFPESFLAEGQEAERRAFSAVRQDSQVPHGSSRLDRKSYVSQHVSGPYTGTSTV